MKGVTSAELTIFSQFQTFGVSLSVFSGIVIALLALCTS